MLTNADITIYNKRYDPTTRTDKWNRTVLLGVHKYANARATQVNGAERRQSEAVFRIPESCPGYDHYLTPEEYEATGNPEMFWTLRPEDLVVLGVCDLPITGITTLLNNHLKPWKVTAVSDNRRGTSPHLRARAE